VADMLRAKANKFVLDGEIAVPSDGGFSFDKLLQRIHPAQSLVNRLAQETPALFIGFDLLVDASGKALTGEPLEARRKKLVTLARGGMRGMRRFRLSPATTKLSEARGWLRRVGATLDGIVAKRRTSLLTGRASGPACRRSRITAAPTVSLADSTTTRASPWS